MRRDVSPFCSRSRFLVTRSGPTPGRRAKVPRTSGTEDCSPIAPSAGVPTGCRRTLAAARRSAIAPAGSKDGLRSRKAAKGYSSARPTHRAQASGSFSADGSSAPAPQAKCTKRADPDRKILPACKPPPIRDRKTESANPRYGEGFFSKLLGVLSCLKPRHARGFLCLTVHRRAPNHAASAALVRRSRRAQPLLYDKSRPLVEERAGRGAHLPRNRAYNGIQVDQGVARKAK